MDGFRARVQSVPTLERLDLAPRVLGRLSRVNGESLRESADLERALEARDEHKLSYRLNNFDGVQVERGAWWPEGYQGPPRVAIEDREADQLGLEVGDRLAFTILGETVEADLAAIYGQRRFQSRFWLEGIFSDGVLDPFISRYVGAIYMDPAKAVDLQASLAAEFPNVVTVRTEGTSDDNNHEVVQAASVFMKISSDGTRVGCYYSLHNRIWQLVRLFKNTYPDALQVGVSAQSPTGKGNAVTFDHVTLVETAVSDFRTGR